MRKAITYGEAWKILAYTDKKVYFKDNPCHRFSNKEGIFVCGGERILLVPYHPDDKMFEIDVEDNDSFVSYGLHPNFVSLKLYGLTFYQRKGTTVVYIVCADGSVYPSNWDYYMGKISYSGNPDLADVEVHVDEDGVVTYVYLNGKKGG